MAEALAVDDAGNVLVAFHRVAESPVSAPQPLPLALVAVWHADRVLLVFNRYRHCWELPGGLIDPGETPHQAAVRELREETGITADPLAFVGYAQFVLAEPRRTEYGALYTAAATPPEEFTPNDEISAVHWWDGHTAPPGRAAGLDLVLARLTLSG
ncbi:NUDIX hydrolase [Goodfellowiella coeruleoviolacea]|uniref:8-oxo-dGTP diphosphatase n=1 Tax=Goodfellowiella coeruleoviolacea TaxID=334858 RepID=A0AAE3G8Y5_9PSEU|nr:NUDIX hydrolase [Goodfellowiella coeruleoviolacea]MCP2163886.1 8-oxo-dGTP diphosphatase [Goodfellowiella coeruleoviolacea]